jgi:hypothetical protein
MVEYCPDNWVVWTVDGSMDFYKLLVGWSGGYTSGSSWKANSGITRVELEGDYYLFYGSSESVYRCHKNAYCLRMNNAYVWKQMEDRYGDRLIMLPESTDWVNFQWEKSDG